MALLPAVWRGKTYRRAEAGRDEKGRERAVEKERTKWASRFVGRPKEAQLTFGLEVAARSLDPAGLEASRCVRGARWTTLKTRCSDWAPVRTFLLAEHGLPFPSEA